MLSYQEVSQISSKLPTDLRDGQSGWYGDRSPSGYARAIMVCWSADLRKWLDMNGCAVPCYPILGCEADAIKDARKRYKGIKS